jgi:hypothetical protein
VVEAGRQVVAEDAREGDFSEILLKLKMIN